MGVCTYRWGLPSLTYFSTGSQPPAPPKLMGVREGSRQSKDGRTERGGGPELREVGVGWATHLHVYAAGQLEAMVMVIVTRLLRGKVA